MLRMSQVAIETEIEGSSEKNETILHNFKFASLIE